MHGYNVDGMTSWIGISRGRETDVRQHYAALLDFFGARGNCRLTIFRIWREKWQFSEEMAVTSGSSARQMTSLSRACVSGLCRDIDPI
jgi:hypothetical protein